MVRAALSVGACVGLLAGAGCSDYDLVGPDPERSPRLSVQVSAVRGERNTYELGAVFRRGTDARGEFNRLSDGNLYVERVPVRPVSDAAGVFQYQSQADIPGEGARGTSIGLTAPALASIGPVGVTIPIAGTNDPPTVEVADGDDLRLHVGSPAVDSTRVSAVNGEWRLELAAACSTGTPPAVVVAGTGAYPPELRIPSAWFVGLVRFPAAACFRTTSRYDAVNTPYTVSAIVSVSITWRIEAATPMAGRLGRRP